jgi:indolepyruvate ferredoxin oxidoreductase alpha subunit
MRACWRIWPRPRRWPKKSPYNFEEGSGSWGVICNGVSYTYVADAIQDLELEDQVRVLRIGFSHPLPAERIGTFWRVRKSAGGGRRRTLHGGGGQSLRPGGGFPCPSTARGRPFFRASMSSTRPWCARNWPIISALPAPHGGAGFVGCAGNSPAAAYPLRGMFPPGDVLCRKKGHGRLDVIHPSDIGCYTLGFLPPLSMGDFVICMGASTGSAGGFAQATSQKVVSFIGDSTFFHSGIPGLINAVFNNTT